jgi:hypothetical protein
MLEAIADAAADLICGPPKPETKKRPQRFLPHRKMRNAAIGPIRREAIKTSQDGSGASATT